MGIIILLLLLLLLLTTITITITITTTITSTTTVIVRFSLTVSTMGESFMQTKKGKYFFIFANGVIWVLLISCNIIKIYAGVTLLSMLGDILVAIYALFLTLGVMIGAIRVTLKLRKVK